jgi:hypothetical protein
LGEKAAADAEGSAAGRELATGPWLDAGERLEGGGTSGGEGRGGYISSELLLVLPDGSWDS